jgi:hypothetical protein
MKCRPSGSMVVALVALFVALGGTGAYAVGFIGSEDVKNDSLLSVDLKNNRVQSRDIRNGTIQCKDLAKKFRNKVSACSKKAPKGPRGPAGAIGPTGGKGAAGPTGPPGDDAQTEVTSLPGQGFAVTNGSCSLTKDGVECGPYADGETAGGSLFYSGLNGMTLAQVTQLAYQARYESDGDTGGVGAPYLRIFLEGDTHDAIFSPNTQPPDPDTGEGPFHRWAATDGVWRYDDDGGAGGTYGVNGAPYSTLVADHGSEVVSGVYITTGFSAGTNLRSLLRTFEANNETFVFGG